MQAQQRFEADDFSPNRRLRLIVQFEFASCDGRLQVLLNGVAFSQPPVHFRLEETYRSSTILFGSIKCGIGIREQGRGVCAVAWIDGDSNTQTSPQPVPFDFEVVRHSLKQAIGENYSGFRSVTALKNDRELIAAEAGNERLARDFPHPGGDLAQ